MLSPKVCHCQRRVRWITPPRGPCWSPSHVAPAQHCRCWSHRHPHPIQEDSTSCASAAHSIVPDLAAMQGCCCYLCVRHMPPSCLLALLDDMVQDSCRPAWPLAHTTQLTLSCSSWAGRLGGRRWAGKTPCTTNHALPGEEGRNITQPVVFLEAGSMVAQGPLAATEAHAPTLGLKERRYRAVACSHLR
jgi:hypothetical protein